MSDLSASPAFLAHSDPRTQRLGMAGCLVFFLRLVSALERFGAELMSSGVPRRRLLAGLVAWWVATTSALASGPQVPARIVSTSPSITETLFALQLGDHVVGVSTFCRYPKEVESLPKVGTFHKPDAETIARLQPDLVFIHTRPSAIATQLAALGIRAATVDRGSLPSVFSTIQQISVAAGVQERGDALVHHLRAELDRVRSSVARRSPRKVLVIVGRRTGVLTNMVAAGPGSYINDLIEIAGGVNVMGGVALEYPRISMETVISVAPDVIIDVGENGESVVDAEQRRTVSESLWARQRLVSAVRAGAVHVVDDESFVLPGPRVVDVAKTMARWLHGSSDR